MLLNSADDSHYTWRARGNPFVTSGEMVELAYPEEVMMTLTRNETAVPQCQSAMAVRFALGVAGDETGRS
jgi:hypothetical protein